MHHEKLLKVTLKLWDELGDHIHRLLTKQQIIFTHYFCNLTNRCVNVSAKSLYVCTKGITVFRGLISVELLILANSHFKNSYEVYHIYSQWLTSALIIVELLVLRYKSSDQLERW